MKNVFFSIVTPVLNGKNYINDYLISLKNQSYKYWEAIIIDDNSEDDSYEFLKEATKDDKRFKIYQNEFMKNKPSPYAARNFGLTKIRGTYISFLDIDDYWLPQKLESDYSFLKKFNSDILIGNYIKANQSLTKGYLKPRLNFLNINFQIIFCNPLPMLTTTIKREVIGNIKFKSLYHEDYIFWREIIEKNKKNKYKIKIDFNSSENAIYRIHNNSLSHNRLKTINWLKICYEYFNQNILTTYLFLLIRISLFLIEKLALSFKIIKKKNIKI